MLPDESYWIYICKDGSCFTGHLSVTVIHDDAGAIVGFLGIGKDVTQQRQMEASPRDSEARFQTFMDNSPALAFIKDARGKYVFANQKFLDEFQKTRDELIGKTTYDMVPAEVAKVGS